MFFGQCTQSFEKHLPYLTRSALKKWAPQRMNALMSSACSQRKQKPVAEI